MTTIEKGFTKASDLSSAITHAAKKVVRRMEHGNPIPGKIESIAQIDWLETVPLGRGGYLQLSRNGDVVLVTRAVPSEYIKKENIFDAFANHASKVPNNQLVDAVTIVDRKIGEVLARPSQI
ncbi:MAG: hypothetical protein HC794_07250 [Nitrospiraceae bacterium]|nr:hypothetical protein [Nitrospiraceae bacterium]